MLTASQIRQKFLDYFEKNGHQPVASSSLVPKDDPTLLFTNAGMVQFKKTFLGQEKRDYKRATTSQKCLRVGGKHNDLENVGRTARHHTFFEMLGNFSFGDYFKDKAIKLAWEFLTEEIGLDKKDLYITVFRDDDEAEQLWQSVAGVPKERIYRLGEKDNFWSMGDTGPCGPCSEIHVDQGESMTCGPNCGIGKCDCDRFLEIWNLVFMQYNQDESGIRTPLPHPSIDTGMGLERIAAVCQGVQSNFDTDLFQAIIGHAADIAGVKYGADEETDTALRVIADHSRSIAFMIADNILPSNEGRSYVLRRLIRRALRFGTLIGLTDPFLYDCALKVVAEMGQAFPELVENKDFMAKVVREEEERFSHMLAKGLVMLEDELAAMAKDNRTKVSGEVAFKLYDTFGFPLDIVNDVAEKQGFSVDEDGYHEFMAQQKERAKAAWKGSGDVDLASKFTKLLEDGVTTAFMGYTTLTTKGNVVALLNEAAEPVESLVLEERGFLVADATPFYGESGGQLGDVGFLRTQNGGADVEDAVKPAPGLVVHRIVVAEGEIRVGEEAQLHVNTDKRMATARNHTATHLLHAALRKVLGDHVKQAGSMVGPERLRFDFTHIAALTQDEISRIEDEVNTAVLMDIDLNVQEMDYEDAVATGAMALFGEKYSEKVRVVQVPGVSSELCGGTHLESTAQTGCFVITSESGVASGVRRIEGATGMNALCMLNARRKELEDIAAMLKGRPGELSGRVKGLQNEVKSLKKEVEKLAAKAATAGSGGSIMDAMAEMQLPRIKMEGKAEVTSINVLTKRVDVPSVKALRDLMDDVRSKLPSGVACLATEIDGKVPLILYVSKDLHNRFTAPALIRDVAAEVGGSGGGRPDLAQAGGTDPAGIDNAFAKLKELISG